MEGRKYLKNKSKVSAKFVNKTIGKFQTKRLNKIHENSYRPYKKIQNHLYRIRFRKNTEHKIHHLQRQFYVKLVFCKVFNVKTINKSHYQHRIYNPKESEIRSVNKQCYWLLFCNLNEIKIKKVLLSSWIRIHILSYNFVEKTIFSVANLVYTSRRQYRRKKTFITV